MTSRDAALKLADQQVLGLQAQQAQHVQALAESTAEKKTAQKQLRQQVLATQKVQQKLDTSLQAQHEQQQMVETSSHSAQRSADAAIQTDASSTEQLAVLIATAEAYREMQQSMCDWFRLKSLRKASRLHLRSANAALQRHQAGTATAGHKAREQLEEAKILAEQEAEKLHVDCCQLGATLWLQSGSSNTSVQPATDFADDTVPADRTDDASEHVRLSSDAAAAISSSSVVAAVSNIENAAVSDADVSTDISAARRQKKNRRRQERRNARGIVTSTGGPVTASIAAEGAEQQSLLGSDESPSTQPTKTAAAGLPMQHSTDVVTTQDGSDTIAGQSEPVLALDGTHPAELASMQSKLDQAVLTADVPTVDVADSSTQQQETAADNTQVCMLRGTLYRWQPAHMSWGCLLMNRACLGFCMH